MGLASALKSAIGGAPRWAFAHRIGRPHPVTWPLPLPYRAYGPVSSFSRAA
ncbi:hypothetical protein ACFPN0_00455 [Kitasatospora cinereorecta]